MARTSIEIKAEKEGIFVITKGLEVYSKNEDKAWTVYCPDLKVLGYSSKSEEAAFNDFEENLVIFFTIHVQDDTLNEALTSFNWNKKEVSLTQKIRTVQKRNPVNNKLASFTFPNRRARSPRDYRVPVSL